MEFNERAMTILACGTTVPIMNIGNTVWFKGNDCAAVLNYKDPKRAVKRHVDPDWQKPLEALLQEGGTQGTHLEAYTLNDLSAKWISEPGLYDLASSSKLPAAKVFKKWVFGEVLPNIRKTGSYTLPSVPINPLPKDGWAEKRVEGIQLMRLKNASLKELIAGGFGQMGNSLYKIVANHINQAVLGFSESTTMYKKKHQLPDGISIPDILDMQGQVARGYAEECFRAKISGDLDRLRKLTESEVIQEFEKLKVNLRQGFQATGMGELQSKTLQLLEAKERKKDSKKQKAHKKVQAIEPARKKQRLLSFNNTPAIACC